MAANLTKRQLDKTKLHIKTSMILKRLVKHALSTTDIMTPSQVNAANILLKKVVPDMKVSEIDHTSSDGSMSPKEIIIECVDAKPTDTK